MTLTTTALAADQLPGMTEFLIVGHRGAMHELPENSLQSFARAEELGVDEIELDVQLTADGVLVVNHDYDLGRLSVDPRDAGKGPIAHMTLAQAQEILLDSGRCLLTLEEAYEATTTYIQAEVKDPAAVPVFAAFLDANPDIAARTMVTSFGQDALAEMRRLRPDQDTGIILSRFPEPGTPDAADEILERTGSTRYHSFWTGVTREAVAHIQAGGRKVHVGNVNSYEQMKMALLLGADGTTTDDPANAFVWLDRAREEIAAGR